MVIAGALQLAPLLGTELYLPAIGLFGIHRRRMVLLRSFVLLQYVITRFGCQSSLGAVATLLRVGFLHSRSSFCRGGSGAERGGGLYGRPPLGTVRPAYCNVNGGHWARACRVDQLVIGPSFCPSLPVGVVTWIPLRDQAFAWDAFLPLAGAHAGRAARARRHKQP